MKKFILMAIAAACLFCSCEKNDTVVGDGTVSCSPSSLFLKVGETKTFTFVCHKSSIDELVWRSLKGTTTFSLTGGNSISVTGVEAGDDIICCYENIEGTTSHTILGGITVAIIK